MTGVCNVIIPSYTADLRGLNEAGIRHDVRREIELGFKGALLVSETALTPDEYVQMVEWAADEAAGRLVLFFHASFNTLEENIEMAKRAEEAGAEMVLLSYPPAFYPKSLREVYDYTAAFCASTNMAVMLFPVPLWGFERLHPASIPIEMLEEMVERIPNVVAIKAEGGMPSIGGFAECWNRLRDKVVITMPLEQQAIPLATILPLQLIATSNTECLGGAVPEMLRLCHEGKHAEAMTRYWKVDPARRANERIGVAGTNSVHRMAWKYQAWLTGFNGGPLRMPTQRLHAPQMAAYRGGARDAEILTATEPDEEFFLGRNPA
ncbi:MAG: 4-hydroxy-tetrahydrodipicolinate synthase [Microbacteriaceae bacterium]|jgi:4-hydroxy-tetrahydrodipicolinate synthase|nr:4-hydroxy-tetrahydrodipicolinate synthase [Microbacteriaceae bacterium]